MTEHKSGSLFPWLLPLGALAFLVYWPGLGTPYFCDDYNLVFDQPASKILHYFTHENEQSYFYRPIEASFLALVQTYAGTQTWPIQATQIGLHAILAWLVCVVAIGLGFSRLQAALGGLFFILSQANVFAVLSNDTFSQVSATLCGCSALWLLYRAYEPVGARSGVTQARVEPQTLSPEECGSSRSPNDLQRRTPSQSEDRPNGRVGSPPRVNRKRYGSSLLLFALALLSKEAGIAFLPLSAALILAIKLRHPHPDSPTAKLVLHLLPYVLLTGTYLILRAVVLQPVPVFGTGALTLHIGANVIVNLAMLAFAMSTPISSETAFGFLQAQEWLRLAVAGALSLAFALLIAFGLWCVPQRRASVLVVAAFAPLALFPHVLLNKIGELYAYDSMPFVALLVGIALGQLWVTLGSRRVGRASLVLAVCAILASHVLAVRSKAALTKTSGQRAAALLDQIRPFAASAPPSGRIWLRDPPSKAPVYSIFRRPGLSSLRGIYRRRFSEVLKRPDLEVRIVSPEMIPDPPLPQETLVLTLEDDQLVPWRSRIPRPARMPGESE